ncbi:MAG: hypothetical protein R2771_16110 [Saprospiraceae bacterium]
MEKLAVNSDYSDLSVFGTVRSSQSEVEKNILMTQNMVVIMYILELMDMLLIIVMLALSNSHHI